MRSRSFLALCLAILVAPAFSEVYRPGALKTLQTDNNNVAAPVQNSPATLPDEPGLYVIISTSKGAVTCRLFEKEAPKTVANFVGLAKGTKAWKDPVTGRTRHNSLYAGTTFHRVIPEFMIQGGDPKGDGTGGPGFEFADEIVPDRNFSKPGVLAMANSGPNTNGCQFFITVAPAEHLNGKYSIFGEVVSGQEVVDEISKLPRNGEDKPDMPVVIKTILVKRVTEKKAA